MSTNINLGFATGNAIRSFDGFVVGGFTAGKTEAKRASLSRLPEARQGLIDAIAADEQRTVERRASVKRAMRWHLERGKDFPPRTDAEHDILAEVQAEMASDGVAAGSVPFVEGETWWQAAQSL